MDSMLRNEIICGDNVVETYSLFQEKIGGAIPTSPHLIYRPISYTEAMNLVVEKHYLHRRAPTTWAFGAIWDGRLLGVCTIGKPASHTLLNGVAGKENASRVFELNRLWMHDDCPKNSESRFLGWVLRQVPKGTILVSYADTAQGHQGIVYKASNWIFTGTSIPFTDYTFGDLDHRSIPKHLRVKEKMTIKVRSKKNRYVYFTDPKDKSKLLWKTPLSTPPLAS